MKNWSTFLLATILFTGSFTVYGQAREKAAAQKVPLTEAYKIVPIGQNAAPRQAVTAPAYQPAKALAAGNARVILTAGNVWGDGSGYQMLLDADAVEYANIPAGSGIFNLPYTNFEYKIPENADNSLTTQNIVVNNSIGIDIPAGTYDFFVVNPSPGDRIWIAYSDDGSYGRANNFVFEANKTYEFTVSMADQGDMVALTVSSSITTVPAAPTGFTVTPDAGGSLSAVLTWKNPALNAGGSALSSITSVTIQRDGTTIATYTNVLAPGAAASYIDNTPSNGDHTYRIYASNADGDGYAVSATVFVGVDPCLSMPSAATYTQDFEDASALRCFSIYDDDGAGASWVLTNSYKHSGSYSAIHQYGNPNQIGWLVLPKIALPAAYDLVFWSYNRYPGEYGNNSVWISTGSGNPAAGDYKKVWSPASVSESWVETRINLENYAGKDIYIAFRYEGNYAHNWYLDDISFNQLMPSDAGVAALTSPVSGVLGATETVSVKVQNFGLGALTNVPVKLVIDGGTPVSATVPAIAVGDKVEFSFPGTFDFSVKKTYRITAYTDLPGDGNIHNDTISVKITNTGDCAISTFPYEEGIEDDATLRCWNNFYYDGDENGWTVSPSRAHSGSRSISHSDGPVGVWEDGWMVSPKISIPATGVHILSFWSYNAFPVYYGKNSVLISKASNNPGSGNFKEVWSPASVSESWVKTKINLEDYAGQDIYIAFRYEGNYAHTWYLDDLKIDALTGKDAGITAILQPESRANLTAAEPVKIKVKNFGAEALTNVPVSIAIAGGTTLSGIVSSLAINQEVEYNFEGRTLNLSAVQSYVLTASLTLAEDEDASNDVLTKTVINYGNVAVMGMASPVTACGITFKDDGMDGAYRDVVETQTLTFYPATAGNRIKAEFSSFSSHPYQLMWGVFTISGDTLYVYSGNTANEAKLLGFLTGDMTGNLPGAFRSTAADGSMTFVFKKQSMRSEPGWEANITCTTPFPYDAAVTKIVSPLKGGSATARVKAVVCNMGTNLLTSVPVAYKLNGGTEVSQTFTVNLPVGETQEVSFSQTVDLSSYGDYMLEVYTQLPNDGDASNDGKTVSFSNKAPVRLHGYRIFDSSWTFMDEMGAVSFTTNNPAVMTEISAYKDEANLLTAGEYANGNIYVYSYFSSGTAAYPVSFIKLTKDWTEVSKTAITEVPADMAYDYSTGTMYGIYNGTTGAQLRTVNLETGATTRVADLTGVEFLFTLAINLKGNVYGVDNNGNLISINKTTGATAFISNTGYTPHYTQAMAFDHNTGRLFWAMNNIDNIGKLIELDPATGAATDCGTMGGNAEIVALYTPYTPGTGIDEVKVVSQVYPSVTKGKVTVNTGTQATVKVTDYTGKVLNVYQSTGILPLQLNYASGVYFILVENGQSVTTHKVILNK